MIVCQAGSLATLGGTFEKTKLEQVRFNHIHNRVRFFANRGSNGIEPYRPAIIFFDYSTQDAPVQIVQPEQVDIQ